MTRATPINFTFTMDYKLTFSAEIRGHHVYKGSWTPRLNETLCVKKDNRQEALYYDTHAIGVYKADGTLVGHVPIELSRILAYFLKQDEGNFINAQVAGKRKREVGLVVPAKYTAHTKDERTANILLEELKKRKILFSHFDFSLEDLPVASFPSKLPMVSN